MAEQPKLTLDTVGLYSGGHLSRRTTNAAGCKHLVSGTISAVSVDRSSGVVTFHLTACVHWANDEIVQGKSTYKVRVTLQSYRLEVGDVRGSLRLISETYGSILLVTADGMVPSLDAVTAASAGSG